ncbi:unnamed protein product, partial [Prorocentrum cordatum]
MCILAGDFNFYAAGEQREYLAGHLSQPQESSTYGVRAHFDAVFAKFLELCEFFSTDACELIDADAFQQFLTAHWSRVFAPRRVEPDALQEYLPFVQVAPQLSSWTLTYPQFQELVEKLHDSAPGPDGIPYSVWRAHDNCTRILYDFYLYFLASQRLPDDFNEALGVFLPKGSQPGDDILVRREADTTRPISLSNSDNKIISKALNCFLRDIVEITAHTQQRGFVRGRQIVDNLIEMEAHGLVWGSVEGFDNAGDAMFDIASAFPSISHVFLFAILTAMQLPSFVIAMLQALYSNMTMRVVFRGKRYGLIQCLR